MAKTRSRRGGNDEATAAERITLAMSILLLLLLVGSLVALEVTRGSQPARIEVSPDYDSMKQHDTGDWYLPVTVRNDGDRATNVLRVELVRPVPGEQPEVAELDWTFVAGGEEVKGIAVFDQKPTPETIEVDVIATTVP